MRKRTKNIIVLMTVMTMTAVSLSGCGKQVEAVNNEIKNEEITFEVTVAPTAEPVETTEPTATPAPTPEITYTEGEYVVLIDNVDHSSATKENEINADEMGFRMSNRHFKTTKEIDVYYWDGLLAGYVKPDVQIAIEREDAMWYGVTIGDFVYCIKKDELDASVSSIEVASNTNTNTNVGVSNDNNNQNTEIENPKVEVQVTPEPVVIPEPEPVVIPEPEPEPVVIPEPTPVYSVEETIAIVENALRAAGFVKPEELMTAEELAEFGPTAGMGWGIENISRRDPYTSASECANGCMYWGWTMYYYEIYEISDDYVSLKLYTG